MSDFNGVLALGFVGVGLILISYYMNRTPGVRSYKAAMQMPVTSATVDRLKAPFSNSGKNKDPFSWLGDERWSRSYTGWD